MGTPTIEYIFREIGFQSAALPPVVFEAFSLPTSNQRALGPPHPPNTVSPLALRASYHGATVTTLDDVIPTVEPLQSNNTLTRKLAEHGTLLFRDLPVHSAEDFSKYGHASDSKPYEVIGTVIDRPEIAPNVVPTNEAPKKVLIHNHDDSPRTPHAPGYTFLYSHRAPAIGGETPISSSIELFQRAKNEIPDFTDEVRVLHSESDPVSGPPIDGGLPVTLPVALDFSKKGSQEAGRLEVSWLAI
ncbi:hypothetical protein E8E11_001779 [Didymella keratinophila]|nr:hypothetical protein E8E11_001779 [Didymella keratinophila]